MHGRVAHRVAALQTPGVQKHALQGHPLRAARQRLVVLKVTIFIVAHQRHPLGREVHPDLVGAPGFDGDFQQRVGPHAGRQVTRSGADFDQSERGHGVRVVRCDHTHPSFAFALAFNVSRTPHQKLLQGFVQHLAVERPACAHHAQVGLTRAALAKLVLQVFQRAALFGHQQNAAGLAVQAVHQFQKVGLRPGHAQLLDHTKADTGAAMHGRA